jgi:23S rRNA pseudouridine2605 synthase
VPGGQKPAGGRKAPSRTFNPHAPASPEGEDVVHGGPGPAHAESGIKPSGIKEGDRIAKVIARAGICSRRDAEKLIAEGRVKLNGVTVTSPAVNVNASDVVQVNDKALAEPEAARMWRYHKPSGLVTTHKDEKGRPTVFASLPRSLGRVVSVGRLDFNTEGLLLLTNDGEIARRMEIPSAGWTRVYRVRLFGKVTQADLDKLATGVTIAGVKYGPIVADLERSKGMHSWATVSLKEGKNREIKRVMEGLGLKVSRLIRTAYGPFQLGQLAEGQTEEIPARLWREKLGIGRKKRADS